MGRRYLPPPYLKLSARWSPIQLSARTAREPSCDRAEFPTGDAAQHRRSLTRRNSHVIYLQPRHFACRAAAPPESRLTAGGQRVATFSKATDRPARSGATPTTDWHRVLCWDRLAEIAVEHVTRGRLVFVDGAITYRGWEDKEGQKHTVTEIVVRELILLDRPCESIASPAGEPDRSPAHREGGGAART
jgi:single-strand DNA-binding protein